MKPDPIYGWGEFEVDDMSRNPVHYDSHDDKWFFYDEIWVDRYGPFDSREIATRALIRYATLELGYDDELEEPEDYEGRIDARSD